MKKVIGLYLLLLTVGVTSVHAAVSCKATIGRETDLMLKVEIHGMGEELVVRHDGVEIIVVVDSEMLGTKAQPRLDIRVSGPIIFSTAVAPTANGFSGGKPFNFGYAFHMFVKGQEISLNCKP